MRNYCIKQPADPMRTADRKIREDWIKNRHMRAFNFYKEEELKEVDIIIESPVISIDNLIKMKRKTVRAVDKLDIRELKKIKGLSKNL